MKDKPENSSIAIIPARGGSKRVPRKNIKPFHGKPIIQHVIETLLSSEAFDEVMVSTDDQEIADVARQAGAQVPFLRSAANSNDFAGTFEVLEEVLRCYEERGQKFNYTSCVYPTAPLLTQTTIRKGFETLRGASTESANPCDGVLTVLKFSYPIQRAVRINSHHKIEMVWPENYSKRSQDLEPIYHDAGQFYLFKTESLLREKALFLKNSKPIVLSDLEAQDIDSIEDFQIAELKYQLLKKRGPL